MSEARKFPFDFMNPELMSFAGSAAASGNTTLVALDSTKAIKVFAFSITTLGTSAATLQFTDGSAGSAIWKFGLQAPATATTGSNLAVSPPAWLFATSTNQALVLNTNTNQTVYYSGSYFKDF